MNILAINASHRSDKGATALLIERIAQGARESGATFETLTLARLKINRCLQCVYCDRDDIAHIFDAIRACDPVIYATPVYMFTLSALLKLLLERMYSAMNRADMRLSESGLIHHHSEAELSAKPFVVLACCANFEAETFTNVRHYFRVYSRFTGAPQVGLLLCNGTPLLLSDDHPYRSRAAYEQVGRDLARYGRIPAVTQRRANQEIITFPFFAQLKHLTPIKRIVIRASRRFYSGEPETPG